MEIKSFQLTPFVMNCYVLFDEGQALVVDPGDAAPELLTALEGHEVVAVVNTHCHIDHCSGNKGVMEAASAPLWVAEAEMPLLQGIEAQGRMFGLPAVPSPEPSRFLEEGDTIQVGSTALNVLSTPGHSPGHLTLVGPGFAFVGDVIFQGSIGRTDLPGGNHQQLLDSIRNKLLVLPGDTVLYSGHGPETTIGHERKTNPFLV